jgi:hypothetical protein
METLCGHCDNPLGIPPLQPGQKTYCGDGCAALAEGPSFFSRREPLAQTVSVPTGGSDFFSEPTSKTVNLGHIVQLCTPRLTPVTWLNLRSTPSSNCE